MKMTGKNNSMYGTHRSGNLNPFYGKKHTEETRKKMSESGKVKIFTKEHKQHMSEGLKGRNLGKKLTIEQKKQISKTRIEKGVAKGNKNPMFGKIASHGKRFWYKDICFRSSWELAFAKFLDNTRIKWLYESKTFPIKLNNGVDATYTPDFYLTETNEYIEIKGWWRDIAKEKYECFLKQHNEKIRIIEKQELKDSKII
jgi:hypothetical protein